jgi:hypothetical protein
MSSAATSRTLAERPSVISLYRTLPTGQALRCDIACQITKSDEIRHASSNTLKHGPKSAIPVPTSDRAPPESRGQ